MEITATHDHIGRRFLRLTPAQRRAVYQKIRAEGLTIGQFPIVARDEAARTACPPSYAQMRQWFLWQLEPGSSAYHISGGLRLEGRLDVDALKDSFEALVARHESLRTVFSVNAEGEVEQRVQAHVALDIPVIDLTHLADSGREARAREEAQRVGDAPFDLTVGPLLRVVLIRLGAEAHMLAVVMHHIVSDGWSMRIVVDELVAGYQARVQGRAPVRDALPVQYADYAIWQRHWLEAGEKERQLDYWKAQLGTEHPVLQLPVDHMRRADGKYRAARHGTALPPSLVESLRRRAQAQGATLFMMLLTGFQVLLNRYTAQQDVRVGVPIANRHRVESERVVGFFVNTQVMRNLLDSRTHLHEALAATREAALGAQAHQDLPFEQLVEALQPERSLSTAPLFQVMFNHLQQDHSALDNLPGLALQTWEFGEQTAQFELTLGVVEDGRGQVQLNFHYARELFEPQTIERMAGHYVVILDALAGDASRSIAEIDLLGAPEKAQLTQWSVNTQREPDAQPVHHSIARHARLQPEATALLFDEVSLSYGELNRRANRLAHRLIALGVQPDMRVGIVMERSIEMMVGILGILKAGGAYLPLDPEYPAQRLAYMVQDSGIALLLTHRATRDLIAERVGLMRLEADSLDLSGEPDTDPQVALHGENLAYVIYTSGSTGKPKGAAVRHEALHSCMAWMQRTYGLGGNDTVLHKAPFGFDVSVWEMFWPLTTGARLVVANPGDHRDPERLVQLIQRHQITTLNFVPSMLQAFLAHPGIEASTRLKHIIVGGEAMPAETQKEALRRLSGATLQNLYGPTETTIHVTRWTCRDDGQSLVPIGRPISDTQTYILDAELNLVPRGVAGELYLGGVSLARGYLNKPGLSAERFVADPFGQGDRLYRTGDLVRWNAEGQIEYLGRIDHQVKIRGLRIELGEIEAQLLAQPEVREAVVVAREIAGATALIGYVAAHAGQAIDSDVLRERLGQVLPDYMVPRAVMVLPALPLNANGKVERKALPEPELAQGQGYEALQGELEETLAVIWAEVLGLQRVGRNDNFFELGGHSLLALRLLERMRARGLQAQVRTLFQHPGFAAFAKALVQEQDTGRPQVQVPPNGIPAGCEAIRAEMVTLVSLDEREIGRIEAAVPGGAANIQDIYPLAPLQEGILFHHLMQADGDVYVTPQLLAFESKARLEAFIHNLNQVIARHDILRTAVLWEALSEPVQVVWREARLQLEWLDVAAGDDVLASLNADASRRRIDVRHAPMIRAIAAEDAGHQRWLLQLPSHHLVLDHATLELIVEEIALLANNRHEALPAPVPFRRFVAQTRLGVSQAEHEAFFTRMLGDVDEPTTPFNLLDVRSDGARAEKAVLSVDADLAASLRHEARRHGVSAASLFHLAWALVLARATGKDDVVFGTVLFGRMQGGAGADRALGLFINTLPLRIRLGALSVEQCVRETHAALTQLLHHEHASLSLAQRCSALPGSTPLFSALLNYRYSAAIEKKDSAAWQGIEFLGGQEHSNYPFDMSVDDLGEGFDMTAQVHESVDARRVCGFMHVAVRAIVDALVTQSQQSVRELDLLSDEERRWLTQWSVNTQREPDAQPVHHSIARHARLQPEATALLFDEVSLSYGELNRRANRLAHRLIALGVQPDMRVGIVMERSIEMMVGILGILKAGGAYLPLDPEYPAQRLAYMVQDSGIALLLTHRATRDLIAERVGLMRLEADSLDLSGEPDTDPQVALHGENLAYVIYTSGSTGKPKGAAVRHEALHSCMAWMQRTYGLGGNDTVLHKAPFGFDVSVWEMFWPLTTGARLVVANPGDHRDPERLVQLIQRHQITTLNFVPSMLQAFLAHPGIEASTRLKHIIVGGEAMPAETQKEALRRLSGATLQNLYGPTETTIHVTRWTCRDDGQSLVPIGRPISDTQTYILDAELNLVPRGVAGELYLGGVSLARGYLNKPGLSAERFVADPFGQGDRLYRTGDLVRWNAEGQIEYLGRIDHQVKIRGLRIELGEIEAQLLAQPEVREAVVVAREIAGATALIGYVAAHAGQAIDSDVLRERLGQVLPDYMVPRAVMVLPALPLNANGKVERKALPEPELAQGQGYEALQGELEETLAVIWAEVLGLQRVGRNDNFFELGGHSLLALRLLERMRARGLQAQVRTLFQHPGFAAFAKALVQEQDTGRPQVQVPPNGIPAGCEAIRAEMVTLVSLDEREIGRIEAAVPGGAANIQDIYPLAPLQEGILFHHLLQTRGDVYVYPLLMSFDSRERLAHFIESFNQVIARHDILRTAIAWEGLSEPVQVVWREARLQLQWLEEDATSAGMDVAERLNARVDPIGYRIDVRRAPMVEAVAAHDAAQKRWLLQLPCHHLISDHTTLELLMDEITSIQQKPQIELPPPVPFRDFVARARLGLSPAEHEDFFKQMLGDVTEPTTPFGLTDVRRDGSDVDDARLALDATLASHLRRQAQRHGVSPATLFHLAWALVLARATGKDDLVFGTVLFGRMQGGEGAERAMGLCMNMLPLRIRLGALSVEQCVRETHAALTQLMHHEHASLSLAQRCSGLPKGAPLFSSLLNYRHSPKRASMGDSDWEGIEFLAGQERSNYPLGLSVSDLGDGFALTAQVSKSVGAARVCEYMQAAVAEVVDALVNRPGQPAREIDVMAGLQVRSAAALPPVAHKTHEAPKDDAERTLAAIWAQLLGLRRIGRHDNFFQLGGDSLLSLKMMLSLREQLPGSRRLSLADVMQAGTLEALAARC
ncbi:non-ribosomal peptide synthetase [Variovorax sp. PAMC26660]|uniref:non-ribosomal peptide synthetase n=1 Tax=Variovorax sp. PAMC26660 TaxID=2762322 RepID=UPI00164EB58A|nr:non-ribosomal peptide synthetase [Variovorax sp. PAMC26660]QNK68494.1 amino acid adenylation domain-containing protein [Variovorax sp. PAMC26660]